MPQIFQVLRCYKCRVFQVQQSKKSLKWKCKMCGEKQSTQKVHGSGSGSDCRKHVQKLNMLCGELREGVEMSSAAKISPNKVVKASCDVETEAGPSKWEQFLDVDDEFHEESEEDFMTTTDRKELKAFRKESKKTTQQRRTYDCGSEYASEFGENEVNFNPAYFGPDSFIAKFTAMSSRFSSKISGIKKTSTLSSLSDEYSDCGATQKSIETTSFGEHEKTENSESCFLPKSPQRNVEVAKVTKKRKADSVENSSSSKWSRFIDDEEEEEEEEEM